MPWFKITLDPEYIPYWWQFRKRREMRKWLKEVQEKVEGQDRFSWISFTQLSAFWSAIRNFGGAVFRVDADSEFSRAMIESAMPLQTKAPKKAVNRSAFRRL